MLYTADLDPRSILVIYLGVLLIAFFIIRGVVRSSSSRPVPKKTPEDLAQDAAWYRAEGQVLEAREDYLLKHASLQQTEKFIKDNIRK